MRTHHFHESDDYVIVDRIVVAGVGQVDGFSGNLAGLVVLVAAGVAHVDGFSGNLGGLAVLFAVASSHIN